jgi:hypothetical protein
MSEGSTDLRPELTRLATSLGAELRWVTVPSAPKYRYIDEIAVVVSGTKVEIRARTGSKGALIGATFTVEASSPLVAAPVTMRRETWLDRFGKNLFINREFQFGDDAFDRAVYIESDVSDASLRSLLGASDVRAAIATLVGVSDCVMFAVPASDGKPIDRDRARRSISASIPVSKFEHRETIATLMDTLVRLGRALDGQRMWIEEPPRSGIAMIVAAFALSFVTWITAWAFAAFGNGPATIGWRAYERGASLGVACWAGTVALAIALFRGRSTSLRSVIALAVLWLGLVPFGGTIADRLNAHWDHGAGTTVNGAVWIRYGSKGPPHVHVDAPPAGTDIIVPQDVVDRRIRVGPTRSPARILVADGALGSKWIAAVEPP